MQRLFSEGVLTPLLLLIALEWSYIALENHHRVARVAIAAMVRRTCSWTPWTG